MRNILAAGALLCSAMSAFADHTVIHTLSQQNQAQAPEQGRAFDDTPSCTSTQVFPVLATDGTELTLTDPLATPNRGVLLRGYAYSGTSPTGSLPEGDGRRQIYCGCQRIVSVFQPGIDEAPDGTRSVLRVPDDAPSGHYSLEILDQGAVCDPGGASALCEEPVQCLRPSLTVAPAHIAVTANKLVVTDNSEPTNGHPAEMQFTFAAASGVKPGEGNEVASFHGAFPAGGPGRSHLTYGDNTTAALTMPLFSAAEHRLTALECREECAGRSRDTDVQACRVGCDENLGNFNDLITVAVTGLERDTDPDTGWTGLVGAAVAAGVCYKTGDCLSSVGNANTAVGLGQKMSDTLKSMVGKDDDDKLGAVDLDLHSDVNDWGINRPDEVFSLSGGTSGAIGVQAKTRRVPAPSVMRARIIVENLRLSEGYEVDQGPVIDACRGANDVSVHIQAFAGGGAGMTDPERLPKTGVFKMRPGDRITLDEVVFEHTSRTASEALVTPYLFLSAGVWEEDGGLTPDLIGYGAKTHFFADLVAFPGPSGLFLNHENQWMRRVILNQTIYVNGYAGSDRDCFGVGIPIPGSNVEKGRAELGYRIEAEWLVSPKHLE